ncbi:nicotianamine synthase, S-adenosyl-L-methionine-dependent methyltransferase [Tanacetum coccineum]
MANSMVYRLVLDDHGLVQYDLVFHSSDIMDVTDDLKNFDVFFLAALYDDVINSVVISRKFLEPVNIDNNYHDLDIGSLMASSCKYCDIQPFNHPLGYVCGTLDYGLELYFSSTSSPVAYSDAHWARCQTSRRSTLGYCVFVGNNLLSWSSVAFSETIGRRVVGAVEGIGAVSALGARSHVQESDSDSPFTLIKEGGHQTKGEESLEIKNKEIIFSLGLKEGSNIRRNARSSLSTQGKSPYKGLARAVEKEVGHRTMDQFIQQDPFGLQPDYLDQLPKRQYTLSRSNTEVEYRGIANAVVETSSLHNLLREFHALF